MVMITLFLSSCGDRDISDLEKYVAGVKAKPPRPIEQIPAYEHIPPHYYEVQDKRDPFIPLVAKGGGGTKGPGNKGTTDQGSKKTACPNPGSNRVRVGLELVPLDALQMVGWLEEEHGALGALVILKGDGTIHHVKQSDYIGDNYGKIINVSERKIEVLEQLSDGKGCWKPEITAIQLSAQ